MKKFIAIPAIILGFGFPAQASTNPSSLMAKVIEVRLSVNPDCTGGVTIFQNTGGSAMDFIAHPTLGSGVIPNGTYHCISVHLSDIVTATPQADDGTQCHAGVAFTQDLFTSPGSGDISYTPGGALINGTGSPSSPSEDDPWIYFTDDPKGKSTNTCFIPPFADCNCSNTGPCQLPAPLTVSGDQTHTLVVNFDNSVGDFGNGRCELRAPTLTIH